MGEATQRDSSACESKVYMLENILVVVMLGSAIGLQVLKRRRGQDNSGPLLLRVAEALSGELI